MKKLMLGTALVAAFGSASSAQDLFRAESDPVSITASDFIGKRVYAAEAAIDADEYAGVQDGWEDIGEINDLVITRDGQVDSVLVDIGGFLGIGERQVAVGMESVRFVSDSATAEDANDYFLVINADRSTLEGAPEYVRPTAAGEADVTEAAPAETNVPAVDEATGADTAVAATDPAAAPAEGAMATDGYVAVDAANVTAEDLMGVRVYGSNDEDLGEISDLVLTDAGAPAQVIVDVGGFLGIGEKPVAIEMGELQFMQASEDGTLRAYVSMTQEQLEALPPVTL